MTSSVDPDQTAPEGAVWSGSTLYAMASNVDPDETHMSFVTLICLGCLYSISSGHLGSGLPPEILHRRPSLVATHQAFLWHGQPISAQSFKSVCMLCIPALFRTSVSGILSCLLIFRSFLRQLKWKWLSLLAWCWYTVQVSHAYKRVGSTTALKTFSFVSASGAVCSGSRLFAQTCLSENLGSLRYIYSQRTISPTSEEKKTDI